MSYSTFTNRGLNEKFGIVIDFRDDLFARVPPRPASDWLYEALRRNTVLAVSQSFEKPRSEFLVAPVLTELYTQAERRISLFSGWEFNVDPKRGLFGRADFLICRSPIQTFLTAPVVVAVEAKKDDFDQGATQCIAEMVAARIFNERENTVAETIYGCITTGNAWRFLRLRENQALIDTEILDVNQKIERILGILWAMSFDEIPR